MQRSTLVVGVLIYLGAALQGWRVLPGPSSLKWSLIVVIPAVFAMATLVAPLQVPTLRRLLERYVWMSWEARFGRTLGSILGGFGLLVFAAVFIYLQIAGVAHGGRYPAGVFSGYAAGVGALAAQALMTGRIERAPGFSARLGA